MTELSSLLPVKTAVIGASGNVGRFLWRSYRTAFPDCVGTSFSHPGDGLTFFDIRRPDLARLRLEETGHRAIAICSANPNVAYCEQQKEAAYAVNVEGTLELIRQAGCTGLQVIFFSTDYVFEGREGPHDDDTPPRPTTEYGRQKVAVENALPSLAENYLILRLSKIFATQKGDRTMLDEIASALAAGQVVRAARDQVFCPTYVGDLVQAVHGIQARGLKGVMNVAHPRKWSRADVAIAMAKALPANPALVEVISLYDIPAMAGRPLDTSMACSRLMREVGPSFQPLETFIAHVAANWCKG
jgi:dTDP-4-dehydrorhamnose reductase